jgi:hypothetical protein
MPAVFRAGPYTARFFSNDRGEPPHIHVDRNGCTMKLWLETPLRIALIRGYPEHEIGTILKMVEENRYLCLNVWEAYFGRC